MLLSLLQVAGDAFTLGDAETLCPGTVALMSENGALEHAGTFVDVAVGFAEDVLIHLAAVFELVDHAPVAFSGARRRRPGRGLAQGA